MRKLSVKRKWSICECASKIYLYVQCSEEEGTHKINGAYFKEFRLKNGKTVETEISNEQTAVLITSSTMQTAYNIPAGEEDVSLLTAPSYDPSRGNPFTVQNQ